MTLVVLFILGLVWTAYLLSFLRNQARVRSANSVSSFTKHLEVLDRARPAAGLAPVPKVPVVRAPVVLRPDPLVRPPKVRGLLGGQPITVDDARRRRGEVLRLLVAVTVAAVAGSAAVGGPVVYAAFGAGTMLSAYVLLLVRAQKLATQRAERVHYLDLRHVGAHEHHAGWDSAWDGDPDGEWDEEWDEEWSEDWDTWPEAWDEAPAPAEIAPVYRLAR